MLPSPALQTPSLRIPQPHQKQSLPCHFHLYPVTELKIRFENCQQMLNSISVCLGTKHMTVDRQKRILEETEKALKQRRLLYNMEIFSNHKSKKPEEESK